MWSSAVVDRPPQCLMYFGHAFLPTTVVKNAHLSSCRLPFSLNRPCHSPLIFLNKVFQPEDPLLTRHCSFAPFYSGFYSIFDLHEFSIAFPAHNCLIRSLHGCACVIYKVHSVHSCIEFKSTSSKDTLWSVMGLEIIVGFRAE